jgi:hypothetical protein
MRSAQAGAGRDATQALKAGGSAPEHFGSLMIGFSRVHFKMGATVPVCRQTLKTSGCQVRREVPEGTQPAFSTLLRVSRLFDSLEF